MSTDIDWTKPVEYLTKSGQAIPVICSGVDSQGNRHVVLEDELGRVHYERIESLAGKFRNVRRKVTHKATVYVNLYVDGQFSLHETRNGADSFRMRDADESFGESLIRRIDCREVHFEWKGEVDG